MFTAKPQKNRSAATMYFDEHLSHNDYYTQGESQAGYWIGQGAEHLGLKEGEAVGREAFLRLCDNQNPETGNKLTQLQLSERRIFFDFTCSAPKSVSILAVTMDDRRILDAHREASDIALKELESFAATRIRKDGAMDDRTTGNLIGAAFRHTSSRALDPQLHTHFTLFNATFDPVEKRWKALQSSRMYDAIRYGTAVYRNELAKRLHGLGYDTRQSAHGFEVVGVDQKLIERFSKRSQQRNAAVAREEKRLGRKLTKNEVSHVVHQSRPRKLKDASEDQVRGQQLDELGFLEKRRLKKLVVQANGERKDFSERVTLSAASDYALAHVFARQSVAPEHQLLEAALVKACGQIELPELKHTLGADKDLVRVGSEFSTRSILEAELKLIHTVNDGLGTVSPMARHFPLSQKLGEDQRAALALVLSSPDRVTGFQGLAGTGKTTALKELEKALVVSSFEPVFCAPTAAATEVLRKDGFKTASTLAKLLTDEQAQAKLGPRSVLVLDEAGAVGLADMQRFFDVAQAKGARVVLSGDTGQHAAVAQGDALRIIEDHSGYRFGQLTQIRRQKNEALKEIVSLAAEQKAGEAFKRLQAQGEVVEVADGAETVATSKLYQKAAAAYLSASESGRSALIVSPTWAEIEAVTAEVREQLKERGTIAKKEETHRVFDSLGWTDAQKGLADHYEPGQQVRFVKKTEHFKAGELAEVVEVKGKTVFLRRNSDAKMGEATRFHPGRSPASFDVGTARELSLAAGDWLLLQANAKIGAHTFTNGERVQVRGVSQGLVLLKDGRTLPPSYRSFNYGYAVTSHAAQSKTVDQVVFVASSRSFAAVSQESFYVGISRARDRAQVFTDDAELLGRRVQETHTRKAAVELAGLQEALQKHGLLPPQDKQKAQHETTSERIGEGRAFRNVRALRVVRAVRSLRVEASQRLAKIAEDLKRWMSERAGLVEARKQGEALTPRVTREQTLRQRLMVDLPRQRPDGPRQSRGHSI